MLSIYHKISCKGPVWHLKTKRFDDIFQAIDVQSNDHEEIQTVF